MDSTFYSLVYRKYSNGYTFFLIYSFDSTMLRLRGSVGIQTYAYSLGNHALTLEASYCSLP
ncbi:hypothetical protein PAXRUDRAFT_481939 [Paxillus rubicundulus Ve08.2h10]|uniref:Uncharacterized protein n=1 Tax=Paxillus rubicundulus Ve08.2h10 TaxID=930991 RepID=A0A0D0CK62_9AGAM|nr:hypothetical protein PAXRUDRAFT_481939 [Paxillus rubicundulus Ve08.2h10]